MAGYHILRTEKEITESADILEIIRSQTYLTMAMCRDGQPYLVTLNYAFDEGARCFYFHSALKGRKLDILRENPIVWVQVMEDRGYLAGECSYAYRTVQCEGRVVFLENTEDKRAALRSMIDQLEPDPEPVRREMIEGSPLKHVAVGRIEVVGELTAKQSPAVTGEAVAGSA